jgi:hypothetical protein
VPLINVATPAPFVQKWSCLPKVMKRVSAGRLPIEFELVLLALLPTQRLNDGLIELPKPLVGFNVIKTGVIMCHLPVVADDDPQGKGCSQASRVAEFRQRGSVVDRHVVSQIHEFQQFFH